ncbi:extracellular solute-binding protein [Baaleninema sp.]|uniref:extracellular solute-binding protein n=1 Tax=Baaleninema sp. TaxID=3101197 RepID=UPI003CFC58FF
MSCSRRSVLVGAIALSVSQLVAGCQSTNGGKLTVKFLKDSVPAPMLGEFRRRLESGVGIDLSSVPQLSELFEVLVRAKAVSPEEATPENSRSLPFSNRPTQSPIPDLVLIGDYWLPKAVSAELIRPLNPEAWTHWEELSRTPIDWKSLVTVGEVAENGSDTMAGDRPWAAPYRWGSMAIAYNVEKFKSLGWTPRDWGDLWRSELQGRIALPDSPRQTIGLTLKKLGKSYNLKDLASVKDLEPELRSLHQQTRLYSSTAYQQPLQIGDVWAAVGSSRDLLAMPQYGKQIAAVVPKSGTSLWADLWVRPAKASTNNPQITQAGDRWIDFCWDARIARQLSLLTLAASPALLSENRAELPEALQNNPVLLPEAESLQRSEFIEPLTDEEAIAQYRALWRQIRR